MSEIDALTAVVFTGSKPLADDNIVDETWFSDPNFSPKANKNPKTTNKFLPEQRGSRRDTIKMPGPGPHLMYAMSSGLALTHLSKGRFTPHHTLTYTLNAFFGPDIGSFSHWLISTLFPVFSFLSSLPEAIHHPFYYALMLGLPLCVFYSWSNVEKISQEAVISIDRTNFDHSKPLLLVVCKPNILGESSSASSRRRS
ncbi:hypothetical protein CCACVL1_09153 [Corchorus capsularis]|uniref:Uncharacterized protein n=1 Tax=Corchorus capsularis TaxID=210143 RepID=A0A1R3IXJ1_COCAP|nr:hypothetical protein CCACVL1_09153 [Corchorus capsularis]